MLWRSILQHSNKVPEEATKQRLEASIKVGSQSRGSLVMVPEGGGQQCSCPGTWRVVTTRAWSPTRQVTEITLKAPLVLDLTSRLAKRVLSVVEKHRDSVQKSCEATPAPYCHQTAGPRCFSFVTGTWLLWHEPSQERFSARGEGKILLQESAAFSSQQGGLWGGWHNDIFGEKHTPTGFISHIRISKYLKG